MTVAFVNSGTRSQSAGTTSLTPALPASRVTGNLLIARVASKNNATHSISGTGWAAIPGLSQTNSGASFTTSWWYRIVDGTEAAPTISWTGSVAAFAQIEQCNGNDPTTPFGAIGTPSHGTSSPHTSAGITTTADNSTVLAWDAAAANTALSTPSGWTEALDNGNATGATRNSTDSKVVPVSGSASGNISVTGAAAAWVQVQVEILALVNAPPTTWASNTADKSANVALSVSNTKATTSGSSSVAVRGTTYKQSNTGKYYWEATLGSVDDAAIGLANVAFALGATDGVGSDLNSVGYFPAFSAVVLNDASLATIQSAASGNTVCFAWDAGNQRLWIRTNGGNWNNSGTANPATNTGGLDLSTMNAGPLTTAFGSDSSGDNVTYNWGNSSFAQSVPSGFSAWDAAAPSSAITPWPFMRGMTVH